jgi:hypothetical protein
MIAGAISFNSGILLFAADVPSRAPGPSASIFPRAYGSSLDPAQSIVIVRGAVGMRASIEPCRRAREAIRAVERTRRARRDQELSRRMRRSQVGEG